MFIPLLRSPGVLDTTNQSFLEASEIRLRLSPEYNTTYLTPAWTIIESFQTIKEVHSHYDPSENISYLSVLDPLADNFYHSVADFEPRILIQNTRDDLAGQECNEEHIGESGRRH